MRTREIILYLRKRRNPPGLQLLEGICKYDIVAGRYLFTRMLCVLRKDERAIDDWSSLTPTTDNAY